MKLFSLFAMVDVAGIFVVAQTTIVDGWAKLGAIGILGALLLCIVYYWPKYHIKSHEEARAQFKEMLEQQSSSLKEQFQYLGGCIEAQTVESELNREQVKQINEKNAEQSRKHQQEQIEVLRAAVGDKK